MHNQHARLSQVLTEQRTTERHGQAARSSIACHWPVPPSAPDMGGPSLVATGSVARRRRRPARPPPVSQQWIDRR